MKLGTATGSLTNHLLSRTNATPEVGMAATILHWTDRNPATVIYVSPSGKTVRVQTDSYRRTDENGVSENQEYEYSRDPNGAIVEFRFGKRGWRGKGGGPGLCLGRRERHYDYSF